MKNILLKELIYIGFCIPKFYKPTVWKYAKKVMERGVELNMIISKDFGRGKGKYSTKHSFDYVFNNLKEDRKILDITNKYIKYKSKL